jgi:hypothetical protein
MSRGISGFSTTFFAPQPLGPATSGRAWSFSSDPHRDRGLPQKRGEAPPTHKGKAPKEEKWVRGSKGDVGGLWAYRRWLGWRGGCASPGEKPFGLVGCGRFLGGLWVGHFARGISGVVARFATSCGKHGHFRWFGSSGGEKVAEVEGAHRQECPWLQVCGQGFFGKGLLPC